MRTTAVEVIRLLNAKSVNAMPPLFGVVMA
jgi:hypothetical protein